ncbi:MAG: cytochrome-c oxidase, cbb3-type subunit III [Alphaproteobacteria bacterium]|nr:cytochrome-c oxidase, cbb3-type subunit III [Alphaproteobacteria bacterium]
MSKQDQNKNNEPPTTGHEWDGIREYDNPLPRWWLWTFYATIVWAIGFTIAYPAWPMLKGATPGLLGYSSRADVADDIQSFVDANAQVDTRLASVELSAISDDPELKNYALNGGKAVFATWCAQCHGAGANGIKAGSGFPNLIDDDWLWGGKIEDIHATISNGIRDEANDDTRYSEMPKFGEFLEPGEIGQLVQFVRLLSNQDNDATKAAAGKELFAENCSACHGDTGKGDRDQGAPDLTDAIWLYGGDSETLTATITNARFGVMPAWAGRLSESQIRQVATYVHDQGGGE